MVILGLSYSSPSIRFFKNTRSLATSLDSVAIRPDIIFNTKPAYGTELDIANDKIEEPDVPEMEVAKARVRVLETARDSNKHVTLMF